MKEMLKAKRLFQSHQLSVHLKVPLHSLNVYIYAIYMCVCAYVLEEASFGQPRCFHSARHRLDGIGHEGGQLLNGFLSQLPFRLDPLL